MPLLRISQHQSNDLYSVTEYYSSELVAYVRGVLEVGLQSNHVMLHFSPRYVAVKTRFN
jgi:hypothetical protein